MNIKRIDVVGYTGMGLTAISLIYLGNASWLGWVAAIIGSVVWIAYSVVLKVYPVLGINIILILIDIRGMILWLGH